MNIRDTEFEDYKPEIKMSDFENFLTINEDSKGNYVFNLNANLYININKSDCQRYQLKHDMFWPLISYKIHNTTHLAWLLCKINNVKNPMVKIPAGTIVYYLDKQQLTNILQTINS